ncbi:DUF2164 domain-containing protein [Virgibacillus xinjiangensis]|uniref:DUF2164 domain-containing protein n=1 Tax=Virgibacillus xinjiangensis TaxID=393090 RepID=A0ABV7CUB2_9BACI
MYLRLSQEQKERIIRDIKDYFFEEHAEEIGELAAGNFLDFMVKEIGPYLYNEGIHDARDMLEQKLMNLDEDVQSLEKPVHHNRD